MSTPEKRKDKRRRRKRGSKVTVPYLPLSDSSEDSDQTKTVSTHIIDDPSIYVCNRGESKRNNNLNIHEQIGAIPKSKDVFDFTTSPDRRDRKGQLTPEQGKKEQSPFKTNGEIPIKTKSPFKHSSDSVFKSDDSSETKPLVDNVEMLPIIRSRPKSPICLNDLQRPSLYDYYKKLSILEEPDAPDKEDTSQSNLSEAATECTEAFGLPNSSSKMSKKKKRKHKKIVEKSESSRGLLAEASYHHTSEEENVKYN